MSQKRENSNTFGQRVAGGNITIFEGKILDGRNRFNACQKADVEPRFETYDGDDPIGRIAALNDERRHDSDNERALVGARMANLRNGSNRFQKVGGSMDPPTKPLISVERAAELSGSNREAVKRAKHVLEKGSEELIAAVKDGSLTVKPASYFGAKPRRRSSRRAAVTLLSQFSIGFPERDMGKAGWGPWVYWS